MSEHEFETYLSLLCRLLRLDTKQRDAIARELRDHLEERLADLTARGAKRDEAVRLALEEFGDAAGLAAEFSSIARNVKRRWLMRMTLGTTIAAAAVAMAAMALWPETKQPGPAPLAAVAQEGGDPAAPGFQVGPPAAEPLAAPAGDTAASLERRIKAEFAEAPLADLLEFLSDAVGGQFYVNRKRLAAEEISLDAPISLQLRDVRADMLLDLALKQASDRLAYAVRDGVVMISTLNDLDGAAEVRVYNVRDLLRIPATGAMPGMGAAAGIGYGGSEGAAGAAMQYGAAAPGMAYGVGAEDRTAMLSQVIRSAVGSQHWNQGFDYGTIASYDGLLVVNHNARMQQQVERLLEMLRFATQAKAAPGAGPGPPGAAAEQNDAATRQKFQRRIAAQFHETPLADVLDYLSDALAVQVYVNWKALEAAESPKDAPVTLNLTKVRGAMALELALAQAGEQLAYVIREGIVVISTVDDLDGAAMLRVYNCRDLLSQPAAPIGDGTGALYGAGGAMPGYGGGASPYSVPSSGYNPYGAGPPMMMGATGGMDDGSPPVSSSAAAPLVKILTTSIAPSSWQAAGGNGTIAEYSGLIVVNHNARVHAQVEQVLKMVRQAAAAGEKPAVIEEPR